MKIIVRHSDLDKVSNNMLSNKEDIDRNLNIKRDDSYNRYSNRRRF